MVVSVIRDLESEYRSAFRDYLETANAHTLAKASEVGQNAFDSGMGIMDLHTIHGKVTAEVLSNLPEPGPAIKIIQDSQAFLQESLNPFESSLRECRERASRTEEEAAGRLEFLAELSSVLAGSLQSETTLRNIANRVVPFLADWCFVYIRDEDGTVRRVAIANADPAKNELARSLEGYDSPDVLEWVQRAFQNERSEIIRDLSWNLVDGVPGAN